MALSITVGASGGRTLFGVQTVTKAKAKSGPEGAKVTRRTLRFVGRFVEYAPGAREPRRSDTGAVAAHSSTTLDEAECSAMLAACGASSLDDGTVGAIIAAVNEAAAKGEPFALRLPPTAAALAAAPKPSAESIIAAAAAFDPLA